MSKKESVQKRLQKVRPPRVQMTYDVEIGDAIENKELPFVMGVVGDFGGNSEVEQKRLKERKFIGIDRDNFDEVLKGVEPRAAYGVANELSDEGGQMRVDLRFRSLDDFRPEAIVKQVPRLAKLLEVRQQLRDLLGKLDGNDELDDLLNSIVQNSEELQALKGAGAPASGTAPAEPVAS